MRHDETLQYIEGYRATHGYGPSMREIAAHLGCSLNTVWHTVAHLERSGRLTRVPGIARTMKTETEDMA